MKLTVYIGYDSSNLGQVMAYSVCRRSIRRYNSTVEIRPIKLDELRAKGIYYRDNDNKQSTQFTYSRFLTPYLNDFKDYAVFCDSDFLWQTDIEDVLQFIDERKSVACVQHEYVECPSSTKMDGLKQEWYPRKNWSSLMVFNCGHEDCKHLTVETVNTETPKYLHRLMWTHDENLGNIPIEYNYLVGYYSSSDVPAAYHFTDGGPWHEEYTHTVHSDKWLDYLTADEKILWQDGKFWEK
jgi:lipopolysaccharide biosynthesis glycosyltransferase